jgi:hypothetical protein
MTHPRRRYAAEVLRDLHPELRLRIVDDPQPEGPPSALRTARVAWGAIEPGATHHLVIQDDMILSRNFPADILRAVAARPRDICCLFSEWGSRSSHAVRLAAMCGGSWAPLLDPYVPTTAIVMPADLARDLAASVEPAETGPDDVALLRFVTERGLTPLISVPNLAEHEASESLIGNDVLMGPRHATLPADPVQCSPLLPELVAVPHLLLFEGVAVCQVRDSATSPHWRVVKAHDYLAPAGLGVRDLIDRYAASAARVDAAHAARAVVADSLLLQFWLTAFLYGVVAADLLPDDVAWHRALADSTVQTGLTTLAPGLLRRFVPTQHLLGLADLLAPLTADAMAQGRPIGLEHGLSLWKQSFQ